MPDRKLMVDRVRMDYSRDLVSSIRSVWSSDVLRSKRVQGYRPLYALFASGALTPELETARNRKRVGLDRHLFLRRKVIEQKALTQRGVFGHWQF